MGKIVSSSFIGAGISDMDLVIIGACAFGCCL